MSAMLIVDAFGSISPIPERVAPDEDGVLPEPENPLDGYLWGVFRHRSELMRWSSGESQGKPFLWAVHEAELTFHQEESRIGWAQVGLDVGPVVAGSLDPSTPIYVDGPFPEQDRSSTPGFAAPYPMPDVPATDPAVAIPPLIQCTDDAIHWFGDVELSALQVTGVDVSRTMRPHKFDSPSVDYWFHDQPHTPAVVTFAADNWDDRTGSAVADEILRWNTHAFEFGSLVPVPEDYIPRPEMAFIEWATEAANLGLTVALVEWDTSLIGSIIASVFDVTLSLDPAPQHLAVRVTRTEETL